jgi:hypothetical protein
VVKVVVRRDAISPGGRCYLLTTTQYIQFAQHEISYFLNIIIVVGGAGHMLESGEAYPAFIYRSFVYDLLSSA